MFSMAPHDHITGLLCCPECGAAFLSVTPPLACGGCQRTFPSVGGIPWLLKNSAEALWDWRIKLKSLLATLEFEGERHREEASGLRPEDSAAKRLLQVSDAYLKHRKALIKLLQPIDLGTAAPTATYQALNTKTPATQTLGSYYTNLHRDWAWGERENTASLELVKELGQGIDWQGKRVLVLGGGGCRLPYDIHQNLQPDLTLVIDINPLLLLAAQRILRGETLTLHEFPLAPLDLASQAVVRELRAPQTARPGLHLLFADGLNAPVQPGSFDLVLTPWFIDIIPQDVAELLPRINRLLRPGGSWLNFGSLVFSHHRPRQCYSTEEVLELTSAGGFTVQQSRRHLLPYLQSPASSQQRSEFVFAFAATKTSEAAAPKEWTYLPDWIISGNVPIPATDSLRQTAGFMRLYSDVVDLIDGQRSLTDIAALFAAKHRMPIGEATASMRGFFVKLFEEHRGR